MNDWVLKAVKKQTDQIKQGVNTSRITEQMSEKEKTDSKESKFESESYNSEEVG